MAVKKWMKHQSDETNTKQVLGGNVFSKINELIFYQNKILKWIKKYEKDNE